MSQTSTLTFLFTDIEGSTRLWDSQPDLMRTALARHDAIMRGAIEHSGGLVFKTIGDAFCAAFIQPEAAVSAALDAQLGLSAESWDGMDPIRVRMAIHTGEAESRDDDYFGPPLNRVSRMLSLGQGGQTLLSLNTYTLVHEVLDDGVAFRDLGEHRLKDLQRPEHVYQLIHPKLQESFKPLRSLDSLPNNLPLQVTSFVGRERELREIKRHLSSARLLTLTGSGGTGKTRLGLQAAVDLLDSSSDGSWFVELAPIKDPALVPQTVATALGIREEPGRKLTDTLVDHLRNKRMLIMLDNAEHMLNTVASLADQILRNCLHVQILATSREALAVSGEQTFRVPSMSMPDPGRRYTREALIQFEAVKLFVDRAVLSQPTFEVTSQNAAAIAQLCHRLDGIPMAIELAAARVRALPVERIAERLDDRFRLLTGGSRTALPRQQTLRAMIDWSYDLLTVKEKTLLRRLSVFSGGWSLDAAEQICGGVGDELEAWEILDLLQSLVDKSLAVYDDTVQRYRMTETVRAYGRDALEELSEAAAIKSRHLEYFLRLTDTTEELILGPRAVEVLAMLDTEQKNLRAAMEWGPDGGDSVKALHLANSLLQFFQMRGEYTEASSIYEALLAKVPPEAKAERAVALACLGILGFRLTKFAAAREPLHQALNLFSELGDESGAARVVNTLGVIALQLGDFEEAAQCFQRALPIFERSTDPVRLAILYNNLAILAVHHERDLKRARVYYTDALMLNRQVGNRTYQAGNLSNLADIYAKEGDAVTARRLAREACEMHLELGDMQNLQDSIEVLAPAELALGRPRIAAMLIATKEAVMEQLSTQVAPYVVEEYLENVSAIRAALGDQEFESITAKGRLMTLEEAYRASLED
jgi:predicted ATPase/class 3 adenylate cyclase